MRFGPAAKLVMIVALGACLCGGCASTTAVYNEGFYAEEPALDGSTFRWMGAEATLLLKPAAQDMVLEVGLIVPLEQLPSPPSVTLLLNDAPLDQFVVDDRNIQKRYEVARSAQGSGNVSLKIRTSQTFVPREKDSGSQDGRRLGLIVSSVQWTPK